MKSARADIASPEAAEGAYRKARSQKSEDARNALFQAAAEVVGELGYSEASISRITQRANLASGTFYYYFRSRQDVFDELLPTLGERMLQFVREAAIGEGSFLEKEEKSFRAFFDFLKETPHFVRILNEAELFAPKAHALHLKNVSQPYIKFLSKYRSLGELAHLPDEELEPTVYILMATRAYLAMRYAEDLRNGLPIEPAVSAYMRLLRSGIGAQAASPR